MVELTKHTVGLLLVALSLFMSERLNGQDVSYDLDFSQASNHHLIVTATFDAKGRDSLELFMPVWTPGSYLIREYARHVETISARDGSGRSIPIEKTRKNRWRVNTKTTDKAIIRYRLYCREMSVRTNWVEEGFAILNGAPTFITALDMLDRPHRVRVHLPQNWSKVSTALIPGDKPREYVARDFDYLVDSPIVLGNQVVEKFNVGGIEHELVTLGGEGIWDTEKAAKDLAKIVEQHHKVWQVIPYRNYKFLNCVVEAGGGLEHDNSTLMMTSRWSFGTRSRYLSWLSLASHEFFHTWNIRRLRPVELIKYDYENENYFSTLWIGEGVTSYYDDLLVKRSGLSTEKEYLNFLSRQIKSLQTTEGRLTQSLSDSSRDTWIKFYRPDENSRNARISYYTKGAVAAFLLDAEIRSATKGQKSLDDVMRELYRRYAGNKGFTSAQFRALASEIAGRDLSAWFAHAIDSTEELDYQTALAHYGLQFKKPSSSKKPEPVWTGLSLSSENGRQVVSAVTRNSPAFKAGINVGDELIAIGGFRIQQSDLATITRPIKPGEERSCLVARRGRILEKTIHFEARPFDQWTLTRVAKPTDQQKANLDAWLNNQKPKVPPPAKS